MDLRKAVDDGSKMERAAGRRNVVLDGAAVGEQSDAITALGGDLRERQRSVDGVIQFGKIQWAVFLLDFGAEQTAGVEHDPYHLAAFDFEDARGELVAAGGGGPTEIAHVVALAVVAESF